MRYNITINQEKCLKHGLNVNQAALMALFNELSSWATEKVIGGKTFWWVSRNKVIQELPLFYSKPDTVYRHFKELHDSKMIEYHTENRKDYVCLTSKGKMWNKVGNESDFVSNSEMNPRKVGNESEFVKSANVAVFEVVKPESSEMNPTDNIINDNTIHERDSALAFLRKNSPSVWETFQMKYRKQFDELEWEKFQLLFDCKVIEEELEFKPGIINARLTRFAVNYISGIQKSNVIKMPAEVGNNHPSRKKIG